MARAGQVTVKLDQALELLTGKPAGEPDEEGHFPDDSVNGWVEARLRELAESARAFSAGDRTSGSQ